MPSSASGPQTAPWPGTIRSAPNSFTRSHAAMWPAREPWMKNGVPPLNAMSPVNMSRRSGIHTTTSFVVCAGPT